jgi:DNA polymerase-3 subunit gamma/tau
VHLLSRVKAAGPEAAGHGPAGEADAARARDLAAKLPMNALTRAWSILIKGLAETREAPDAAQAGEMALMRLAFAADLPTPDEALRALRDGGAQAARAAPTPAPSPSRAGPACAEALAAARAPLAAPPPSPREPQLQVFQDVIALAGRRRDLKLKVELESYVHLIGFAEGRIEMRLDGRAPHDLPGRLAQRLKDWTGRQWVVTLSKESGAATVRDARTAEVMAHPLVKRVLEVFPDAELRAIRAVQPAPAADGAAGDDPPEE